MLCAVKVPGRSGTLRMPAILLLMFGTTVCGGERTAAEPWRVEDLIGAERLTGYEVSPADPRVVVWERAAAEGARNAWVTHLFRRGPEGEGSVVQLTRGPADCRQPRYSPDGRVLAFLSARPLPSEKDGAGKREGGAEEDGEAKTQIWVMEGGEPYPVTRWERDIKACGWRDSHRLVFLAAESPSWRERQARDARDSSRVMEEASWTPPVRLFEVDRRTGEITRRSHDLDWISEMSVSPDGNLVVTVHQQSLRFEYDHAERPVTYLTDLRTGMRRRIFADRRFHLGSMAWSPDSRGVYVVNRFAGHPKYLHATVGELWHREIDTGRERLVPLDWDRGLATEASWYAPEGCVSATGDGAVVLLADGVRVRAARLTREGEGWRREFLEGEETGGMFSVRVTEAGGVTHLHYVRTAGDVPPQLHAGRLEGTRLVAGVPVTTLNAGWKDKPKARVEVRRWRGALEDEVEGLLWFPPDPRPGERRPLVVMIHGGPHGADMAAWLDRPYAPIQLHAQRGALVLQVNYHGSANYGLGFAESIAGGNRYYTLPVIDIERGIDAVIDEGLVDPAKIGVLGWSNGAILTLALLVEHPERYQAAASGAGGFEWVADTSITSFGQSFNDYYFGAMPWENPRVYLENAPYYRADRIRTPLIIFHGDADTAVPIHHGWMQFRALQQRTSTPVRFVLFPGEEHGLRKVSHVRRKVEEELAWFDRYLYRTWTEPETSVREGTPLAALLARRQAAQVSGRLGVWHQGRVIPETVVYRGLKVGRFEVTRAQFAEFDPGYRAPAGREDHPVGDLSFDQARRYCEWLSGLTGERWRLPTKAEADRLFETGGTGGNTLDRWAGYEPNPDDAGRLRAAAAAAGREALLMPVGSFAGSGEDPVFDLLGNVAEWTTGDGGQPELRGGSADQPADSVGRSGEPGRGYQGFRVLRD